MTAPALGRVGIWSMELRFAPDRGEAMDAAAELDELGFAGIWVPGGVDDKVLADVDQLLDATRRATIATGIVNVWKIPAANVAGWFGAQPSERQRRAMLGIGISHAPIIGDAWGKPLKLMRDYCDGLDAGDMPRDNVCIAALGPKMTALAGERTAGSHPYLVTPRHTAEARAILGPGKLLAPEQGVVLDEDPDRARAAARRALGHYRQLPNYRNSWARQGFADADIDAMSDGFIDAIFAWGSVEQIARRVDEHHRAGADHVCLQVIASGEATGFAAARPAWRTLAQAFV